MFDVIMNESHIIYRRVTTANKYAEFETIPAMVKARLEMKEKLIRSPEGSEVLSVGIIYTKYKLKRGDELKVDDIDYKIAKVVELKDITNTIQHYVGYMV